MTIIAMAARSRGPSPFSHLAGVIIPMRYLNDKDVASGLLFILVGLAGLFLMNGFDFGSTARPGPGFFPVTLSVLLILIGAGVAGLALLRKADPIERIAIRPFIVIPGAVCLFAVCIERFGLVPAVILAALVASYARPQFGMVPRILLALGLAAFSALMFVVALNLPIALWKI